MNWGSNLNPGNSNPVCKYVAYVILTVTARLQTFHFLVFTVLPLTVTLVG